MEKKHSCVTAHIMEYVNFSFLVSYEKFLSCFHSVFFFNARSILYTHKTPISIWKILFFFFTTNQTKIINFLYNAVLDSIRRGTGTELNKYFISRKIKFGNSAHVMRRCRKNIRWTNCLGCIKYLNISSLWNVFLFFLFILTHSLCQTIQITSIKRISSVEPKVVWTHIFI